MPRTRSDVSTEAFLHTHGIRVSPQKLDHLVQEAIDRLQRDLFRSDPKRDLSKEEIAVLARGGFELEAADFGTEDPLARTAALYSGLLKTSLDTSEAARLLGVDSSRIRHRLTARPPNLYGIRLESGWRIPRFQFHGDRLLPGIGEMVGQLDSELHPVAIYHWFTTPNPDLVAKRLGEQPLSPRQWLRHGFPPRVVAELAEFL